MLQIKRGGDGGAGAGGIGAMALTESDMIGPTRQRLEILVWGDDTINTDNSSSTTDENNSITNKLGELGGQEITLKEGDGIFIPKGWYHAVRGIGVGVNCSVNWWFR